MDIKKKLLEFQKEEIIEYHFYIITVILLILPYILFKNYLIALLFTILIGVLVVLVFTFFVSVVKELDFKKRFFEMAGISLSVSFVSFLVGWLLRVFFNL